MKNNKEPRMGLWNEVERNSRGHTRGMGWAWMMSDTCEKNVECLHMRKGQKR